MSRNVTRRQAEAVLAAVKNQFKTYLEPLDLGSGRTIPGDPPPVLMEDFDGTKWTIMWEEGPSEWTYVVGTNEATEEERVLAGQAREEFGYPPADVTKVDRPPAKIPAGVFVEPITSYSLGVYPA